MKKLVWLSLVVFLLSSCAPAPTETNRHSPTFTSTPSATKTPTSTPTLTPLPTQIGGGKGKLIFDYFSYEYKSNFPDIIGDSNLFVSSSDGSGLTPITNMNGYNFLKEVSPDGTKALFVSIKNWDATKADLYSVDLTSKSEPIKLATSLPYYYNFYRPVKWIDNIRLVYVGQGDKGFGLYIINFDGTDPINIEIGNIPVEVLGVSKDRIYWNTKTKSGPYATFPVWWTTLDGAEIGKLTYDGKQIGAGNGMLSFHSENIAFSPDGAKVAWVDAQTQLAGSGGHTWLQIANLNDMDHPYTTSELVTNDSILQWRSDSKSLLVFDTGSVIWGWGKGSDNYGLFEAGIDSGSALKNYHLADEVMGTGKDFSLLEYGTISPDANLLPCFVFASNKDKKWTADNRQPAELNFLNLETGFMTQIKNISFYYMAPVRQISWIP